MTEKIEIDKNKVLLPGDRIEMQFFTAGMVWLTAAQIAMIEWRLEQRKSFRIKSHSLPANNRVIFTIDITEPIKDDPLVMQAGVGITAAIIGAAIIGAGVIAWLTLDKVYQIMESPAGTIAATGLGSLGIAAAVAIVLAILSKGK